MVFITEFLLTYRGLRTARLMIGRNPYVSQLFGQHFDFQADVI